jgi:hypothetical protein
MTTTEELIDRIKSSAEEQTSVVQSIDFLERRQVSARTPFLHAAEEFIAQHPELLRSLSAVTIYPTAPGSPYS